MKINKYKKGFTLLEILLVIAAIGILAAIVLIAINPNKQIAQARDTVRQVDINTIQKALEQYLIDNKAYPSSISTTPGHICNTGTEQVGGGTNCSGRIDLRELVPTYIAAIPRDTQSTGTSTGYIVSINTSNNKIVVIANLAERKSIAINSLNSPIVKNGLVLNLDAGDTASYPNSGNTWFDLSGNGNNGTLVNGPTYNSANGGVIALDGVNDYIDVPINLTNTNYTIMGAARYVVVGGRTFSAKNNNWLMGHWNVSTQNHYAEGWVSDVQSGPSDTNWRIYAAIGNYSGDSWAHYVNGVLNAGPNTGGSNGPNGFAIGSHLGSSEFSNSHISNLLVYDRVLTAAEVQQNFNAMRGRYGL